MRSNLTLAVAVLWIPVGAATSVEAQGRAGVPLSEPRIPRVEKPWTEAERTILEPRAGDDGRVLGVWSTCARSPELCEAWLTFTDYILGDSTLPLRDRELLILRIGWLNRGAYEWSAHLGVARRSGISEEELRRITEGPDAPGWNDWDAALLRAADELHQDALVSDDTWATLSEQYDQRRMMEAVFTVGQYNLVAMWLNSFGVQLESGFEGFPVDTP